MMKKNRVSAGTSVLAVAVTMAAVSLGVGGCAAATAKPATANPTSQPREMSSAVVAQPLDKARLTGYASASLSGGASGPISLSLQGAIVARLDQLVSGLQKWTGASCMENIQLYQLDFTRIAGAKRDFQVAGYECANLVSITSDGKTVTKVDGGCALLTAVRRLLPATAKATKQLTPPNCVK
jgi:F0F1-type ATP synthase membrane subunit c/vacuolar-type H+-ATPase subunit K